MRQMSQYKLSDVESVIAEMEELIEVPEEIMEEDTEYRIIRSGWWVCIPELDLCLHEGIFLNFEEEEQNYMPDFCITVIRENGQEGWLYYEQDGFLISLANWLHGAYSMDRLENLDCVICKPE